MPNVNIDISHLDLMSIRRLLFTPCKDKKALDKWIQIFLGLDLPDSIVDVNSNCSALQMVWEIYSECIKAVVKDDEVNEDSRRYLYYSCRSGYKTLSESVIEVLAALHLDRSTAHMAAVKEQSVNAQRYVKEFFSMPYLRDFKEDDNKTETWIVRYVHKTTEDVICRAEFDTLTPADKNQYREVKNFIKIIVATMQGTNSLHTNLLCLDEIDVMSNPAAYQQAKAIPNVRQGKLPLTILTSTRKFSFGMVQEEINNAEKSGLKIRHWNLIDIATKCPPSRHLPKLPKITIYRSSTLMNSISEEEYNTLPENEQEKYEKDEGFAGCLSNCKIFSSCKSRLATHQNSTSSLLVPLSQVISNFKTFNIGMARAELLCEKPSSAGLIYPNLERDTHIISAAKMAYLITGDKYPENFTKFDLISLFRKVGAKFVAGMDFGFSHLFATVLGAVYGHRLYVFDTICQPQLEPNQILDECRKLKQYSPSIYPDTENPQMISMLRKDGHRMMKWDKNGGSVLAGIEAMRYKIRPAAADPEMYLLAGDEGVDLLFRHLSMYHWVIDSAGRITEAPDEEGDDLPDAIRYLVLNVFGKGKSKATVGKGPVNNPDSGIYTRENWAQKVIQEQLGGTGSSGDTNRTGGKGKFRWSF